MADHSVDLAEFDRLRQEVDSRTQIANGLVGIELTVLGAGLAVFDAFPDVVIGLAVVSAFLWMLWADHAGQIWKIAAYLSIELAPRLRSDDPRLLGWEAFYRRLDKGGGDARHVLRLPDSDSPLSLPRTSNIGLYISLVFGGSPIVLLSVATVSLFQPMDGFDRTVRVIAIVGATVIAVFAARAFRGFAALSTAIDGAIVLASGPPDASDAK